MRSAEIAHLSTRLPEFGIIFDGTPHPSFDAVFERKNRVIRALSAGERPLLELGIDVLYGRARLISDHELRLNGDVIAFRRLVIATGARPSIPLIPGLREAGYWTSDNAIWPSRQPASMAVIGGSSVGCELGQIYARLGTKVTIIESKDTLLSGEDEEMAGMLREAFAEEGIVSITSGTVNRITSIGGEKVVEYQAGRKKVSLPVDEILVATGREPALEGLGLEEAGVDHGPDGITVDEWLMSSQPDIWACGDATGQPMFGNIASWQGEIAGHNAVSHREGRRPAIAYAVPHATFTDPPVATVGLIEEEARRMRPGILVGRYDFHDLGRAWAMGETRGLVKLVADPHSRRLLGATIIGTGADLLVNEAVIIMTSDLRADALSRPQMLHMQPTIAEAMGWAAGDIAVALRRLAA